MTNTELLKTLIEEKGYKLKFVADYLGLSPYGFNLKITNKQEFKVSEVKALCELLDIEAWEHIRGIFFDQKDDLKSSKNV